ncbi:hypothetical protein F503_00715 [Ophiostoma piceae UAMH 11346]|uniref:Uncharacterized protein n=1 Tax=Ophiostoma piceae (strain UAMH 11346) TaxID=1262450 RepID=S3BPZ2_OPHP1|nr:hypothetical protein F503_00715 [Ophiostoma piceae UAMH 11346]
MQCSNIDECEPDGMLCLSRPVVSSASFPPTAECLALWPAGSNDTAAADAFNTFFRDLARHAPAENKDAGTYHGAEQWYVFSKIPYTDYFDVT